MTRMNAKAFLDTNIIVYAFSSNDPRSEKAETLLVAGGVISVQVLNEFVNVSRRKNRRDWSEIEDALSVLKTLLDPPQPLTVEVHEAAIGVARDYGFHFYDSLIVAAALRAGCSILYSEDLHHGQTIERLTIRNPFVE
jgi:predicted nucleic acid-binding protein